MTPDLLLAIDSATTRVVVALGKRDGAIIDATDWPAGYRHGETLLPAIDDLLARTGTARARLAAIVVGTGPGAFTGLRVGIATAKGLAHGLGLPIIGVSTAEALLAGTPPGSVLLLPAGPSDRLVVRPGMPATLVPAGTEPDLDPDESIVAVDLVDRAPSDEAARGETARAGLAGALLAIGADRLTAGSVDDLATLVPEYVTLPRGVRTESGEVAWSHDRP
ncbi:MAG: tRNA (adenosine(37)-N6)-threonylcarbamoyltransferase complex dimerization subunit type 1 TsaB [Chloroflexota bacterium]